MQGASALPRQAERAVSWHSGFRGGAHARGRTAPIHHAARRRSGRLADHGACATARDAGGRVSAQRAVCRLGVPRGGISPGPQGSWGFVEGQDCGIEYRWADNQLDRLPALVADLLHRQVALIVGNTPSALAAKAATTTVPIVFASGDDPVRNGLVASLSRPGSNVTGISFLSAQLGAKQLGL